MLLYTYKNNTIISRKLTNKIIYRTMFKFASHQGINMRIVRPAIYNTLESRQYASFCGKSKIPKEYDNFDKDTKQNLIANHFQLITDFNLIYENPEDIRLYQIGTLFTNPRKTSYTLSKIENYKAENKPQEIQFLHKPIPVIGTAFKANDSEVYFNKAEIKNKIEDHTAYKKLFDVVMKELKESNITVREALSHEEQFTGYHILLNQKNVIDKFPNEKT